MSTTPHEDSWLHDLVHYPVGHLIGILRDGQLAEQAARSLHEAGYTDVVIFDGPPALESIRSRERAANPLTRAWGRLSIYLESESDARQAALDALGQGHAIVMVYAYGRARRASGRYSAGTRSAHAHLLRPLDYHGARSLRGTSFDQDV
jgi:hypothetical protein